MIETGATSQLRSTGFVFDSSVHLGDYTELSQVSIFLKEKQRDAPSWKTLYSGRNGSVVADAGQAKYAGPREVSRLI